MSETESTQVESHQLEERLQGLRTRVEELRGRL